MIRWLVCACLLAGGCARDGLALPSWTLTVDGRALGRVELPADLSARLPRAATYRLASEVTLPAAWRGRELVLGVGFLGEPGRLYVDGREAAPLNQSLSHASTQLWRVPAAGDTVRLAIEVSPVSWFGAYFGAPPVLSDDPAGPPSVRRALFFNVLCSLAATVTLVVLSLVQGFAWLVDRRRRAHGLYAVMILLVLPLELSNAGLLRPLLGGAHVAFNFGCAVAAANVSVFFVQAAFALEPPPRLFRFLLAPLALAIALAHDPWSGARVLLATTIVLAAPCLLYDVVRVARVARWPSERSRASTSPSAQGRLEHDRLSAALLLGAFLAILASIAVDATMAVGPSRWTDGIIGNPLGLVAFAALSALVLGREQVVQARRTDRLNAELRHQVAARSRELAETLARVDQRPATPSSIGPGAVVGGRYRLVRPIGRGAAGQVYECVRSTDDRSFALKRLVGRPRPEALARFAREAGIAAALHHPHLCAVHDVGIGDDGTMFLVMDLVAGGSLEAQRDRFGDAAWGLPILHQVALGMAAMHEHGIVHRDLKPANLLMSDRADGTPRVQIGDFGIARLSATEGDDTITDGPTRPGGLVGTPAYMAPELARGAPEPQPSADLFAFGVIAYRVLAGRFPFAAAPVLAALDGQAFVAPPSLPQAIGAEISRLVERCLDADPRARPTAAEAARVLGERR